MGSELDQDLRSLLSTASALAPQLAERAELILRPMLDLVELVQKAYVASNPLLKDLAKGLAQLPARTKKVLLCLGKQGWFFYDQEVGLSELWHLEELLECNKYDEIDNMLVQHFSSNIENIERYVIEKFPHRAHIIKSAFSAHRAGEYNLSVPVLFMQVDGICVDILGKEFFMKDKEKPKTAICVNAEDRSFQAALRSPLANTLPVNASKNDRDRSSLQLNRHAVVHGESLDYGSYVNSLKAISLLSYVSNVLSGYASNKSESG